MLFSKRGYVDLVQQLAGEVKAAWQRLEVERRKLSKREEKLKEMDLEVQLPVNAPQKVVGLRADVTSQEVEVTALHLAASQ